MPVDERGQIIIGQAFHKRLEFLEKDTVIREIPKRQQARYCCFVEIAGVKLT